MIRTYCDACEAEITDANQMVDQSAIIQAKDYSLAGRIRVGVEAFIDRHFCQPCVNVALSELCAPVKAEEPAPQSPKFPIRGLVRPVNGKSSRGFTLGVEEEFAEVMWDTGVRSFLRLDELEAAE